MTTNLAQQTLDYWRQFFDETATPELAPARAELLNPEQPLPWLVRDMLAVPPGGRAHILHIGSGPISIVAPNWEFRKVNVSAVDLLADDYNQILAERNITPRVRTQYADPANLGATFLPDTFDLAFTADYLDYHPAPLTVMQSALSVMKPGGWLLLAHSRTNEDGPLWHFDTEDERFIIADDSQRIDVQSQLTGVDVLQCESLPNAENRQWLNIYIRKAH